MCSSPLCALLNQHSARLDSGRGHERRIWKTGASSYNLLKTGIEQDVIQWTDPFRQHAKGAICRSTPYSAAKTATKFPGTLRAFVCPKRLYA
jgi:hypothetical protein